MDQPVAVEVGEVAPARPTHPWCLFRCGRWGYAIGLESVAEVVEVERLVRLPLSPPRVLGLCALRREVIPVIRLGDPGPEPTTPAGPKHDQGGLLVLILRTARGHWGINIDAEGTIVAEEVLDGPSSDASPWGPVYLGTVPRGDTSYGAIDPEATWQNVRQSVEDWYCDRTGRETSSKVHPPVAAARAG